VEVVFLTRLSVIISFGILPLEDLAIRKIPLRIPRVWTVEVVSVIISFGFLALENLPIRKILGCGGRLFHQAQCHHKLRHFAARGPCHKKNSIKNPQGVEVVSVIISFGFCR
jgi:hypothetical protein